VSEFMTKRALEPARERRPTRIAQSDHVSAYTIGTAEFACELKIMLPAVLCHEVRAHKIEL
jgi:hypothetical protein